MLKCNVFCAGRLSRFELGWLRFFDDADVKCLGSLGTLHQFEGDFVTLFQHPVALPLDGGKVHENVPVVLSLYKTVAFVLAEPLNDAVFQNCLLNDASTNSISSKIQWYLTPCQYRQETLFCQRFIGLL